MKYIGQIVVDGYAEWEMPEGGEVEVRFTTGETYLLGDVLAARACDKRPNDNPRSSHPS